MAHSITHPRRCTAAPALLLNALVAAALVAPASGTARASEPSPRFVVVEDASTRTWTLCLEDGAELVAAAPSVGAAHWLPLGLADADPTRPAERGAVHERTVAGGSFLAIRSTALLAAYRRPGGTGGLLSLGPRGAAVLLDSGSRPFAVVDGSAALSPQGEWLALATHTSAGSADEPAEAAERKVFLLDLRGEQPSLDAVSFDPPAREVLAPSLTLTAEALFVGARDDSGSWWVYRSALPADDLDDDALHDDALDAPLRPLVAAPAAGPFRALSAPFARSRRAVAFVAAASSDLPDVHVIAPGGEAVDVTRAPGEYSANSVESHHLVVDDDGARVAYTLRVGPEREVFLHDVANPGRAGRFHVTSDTRFNAYLDQESFIILGRDALLFDAEHDATSADVYRVELASPADTIYNLTATGSTTLPFLKGTLSLRDVVIAATLVVSARGFPGIDAGLQAFSLDGIDASEPIAATEAGDFVPLGGDLYAHVLEAGKPWRVLRVRAGEGDGESPVIETVASAEERPRFLLVGQDRAYDHLPGTGVLELSANSAPRLVLASSRPFTSAALSPEGDVLVLEATGEEGREFVSIATSNGEVLEVTAVDASTRLLPVTGASGLFRRGDANRDWQIDIEDAVATLFFAFLERPLVPCPDAADADDSGTVDVTDAVVTLELLFGFGPGLPAPFPGFGIDPTDDDGLDCGTPR